ncbi:MAG: carotenoid 1,2-hydratase [Pseudomonadota bacterium]|nr:carotenoid 1,2-hydratase [Pseudomonadota bacterium]
MCLLQLAGAGFAPRAALALALADAPANAPENASTDDDVVQPGRALRFPRDHGAHPGARTEWWYATGWLGTEVAPTHGFQITFFRSRTGLAGGNPSRFAARQLLFAHAALTEIVAQRHLHDQRTARWNGDPQAALARAQISDGAVRIDDWTLQHDQRAWTVQAPARDFALQLRLAESQPPLLQGNAGYSRKGPDPSQASLYYSQPQLRVDGSIRVGDRASGTTTRAAGRAWLDHEWSEHLLHPQAVGWDWIGINLFDGSALTVFVLRRRDGSALWGGGSFRGQGSASHSFAPSEVQMRAGRRWTSPASNASYPVEWQVVTPAGGFALRALTDAQELDSRASTGTIYWEGLSELLDSGGQRVGLGYLEMTGYAGSLKL